MTFSTIAFSIRLLFCIAVAACSSNLWAAELRAWKFEATIVSLDDPLDRFGDVRLGDTLRGDFAYDLTLDATSFGEGWEDYDHPLDFQGIRLIIENPRTGGELRYEDRPEYSFLTSIFTDDSYLEESGVLFWQSMDAPLPNLFGLVFMQFLAPGVLTDTSLPRELVLDDWPFAAVYLGTDENPWDAIIASIYSLTPFKLNDFDGNGVVDFSDLALWQTDYGNSGTSDADRDGDSDGLDFLSWQRNIGSSVTLASSVPETNSLSIVTLMTVCSLAKRGRSFRQ